MRKGGNKFYKIIQEVPHCSGNLILRPSKNHNNIKSNLEISMSDWNLSIIHWK